MWDNYDVEEAADTQQARCSNLMESVTPSSRKRHSDSQISLAESDFSFRCGEDNDDDDDMRSSTCSKGSSPDNLKEGRRLLREMKELRKEIKKMGDVSSMNISSPVRDLKSSAAAGKASPTTSKLISNERVNDILATMTIETKILSEKRLEDEEFEDPEISMWDSGYLDQCYEPEVVVSAMNAKQAQCVQNPEIQQESDVDQSQVDERVQKNEAQLTALSADNLEEEEEEDEIDDPDTVEEKEILQENDLQISFVAENKETNSLEDSGVVEDSEAGQESDSVLDSIEPDAVKCKIAEIPQNPEIENLIGDEDLNEDELPSLEPVDILVEESPVPPPTTLSREDHDSTPVLAQIIKDGLEKKFLETNPNISPLAVQRIIDGLDKESFPNVSEAKAVPANVPTTGLSKSQKKKLRRRAAGKKEDSKTFTPLSMHQDSSCRVIPHHHHQQSKFTFPAAFVQQPSVTSTPNARSLSLIHI